MPQFTQPLAVDAAAIATGTLDAARIPNLSATKITSDSLDTARIPNLSATKITSDKLDTARLPDAITVATSVKAGGSTDFASIHTTDGLQLGGAATQWRDELGDITTLKTQGPGVSLNVAESAVEFVAAANLADYLFTNVQLNHDRKTASDIFPHIHCWLGQESVVPNMMIQYRVQSHSLAKTTAWTNLKMNKLVTTAPPAGQTFNAILTTESGIAVTSDMPVSSIVQFRVLRDSANASTPALFTGADPYTGTFSITSFDVHIEVDSCGSRTEFTK